MLRTCWLLVLLAVLGGAGCSGDPSGPTSTGGGGAGAAGGALTGGDGDAGGPGAGGVGGGAPACPATAPDAYGACDVDGLECAYDERPCPVVFLCIVATPMANVFGWRPRPPEPGSACGRAGHVCEYEDCSGDSGMATYWTATCSGAGTWDVTEPSMDLCSM